MKLNHFIMLVVAGLALVAGSGSEANTTIPNTGTDVFSNQIIALGYNDLGMHCMSQDYSEIYILPPFNNLYAEVVRRGDSPQIVTSDVTVTYSFEGNTHSSDKTNFWTCLRNNGTQIQDDIGLTGHGLSGTMVLAPDRNDWVADGIPLTPIMDSGQFEPFPMATVRVYEGDIEVATTYPVVPVSWEVSCELCHNTQGITPDRDILRKHDQLHGTDLENNPNKPIVCGSCHRQEPLIPLGLVGSPGLPQLSHAIHGAHASRMDAVEDVTGGVTCYACHPGIQTRCFRDIHFTNGLTCTSCHTSMEAVANPERRPWLDEPSCGGCHTRPGFDFEQPDTLYRNSVGHMGIQCEACHGSPHATFPTNVANDNRQSIIVQGHAGTIDNCLVCHTQMPDDSFIHSVDDD